MLTREQLHELTRLIARAQDVVTELREGPGERRYDDLIDELRYVQQRIGTLLPPATARDED
ncbi:MAG: hypothetical protein ACRDZ1_03930 [Acidimicrobiia bacterium]